MVTAKFLETGPMGTLGYTDPWFLERCILRPSSDLYSLGITVLKLLTGMSPVGLGWKIRETNKNLLWKIVDPTVENWPFELAKEMIYWSLQCCFHNENSSDVLKGMSTCLEGMLAGIDALQQPEQAMGYGSEGLAPPSHNTDKEVMGETNPLSSSSSFSKPQPSTQGKLSAAPEPPIPKTDIQVDEPRGDLPFLFELEDLLLAQGAFTYGKLYAATSKKDGSDQFAVKRLKDDVLVNDRKFESEVNYLKNWPQTWLLHLQGYYYDPKPKGEKLLVFHSVPNGRSLATFLRPAANNISWRTRMGIAYGIARGLEYLHGMKIIHGNLTGANILLDDENKAKISDYELSRIMTKEAFSDVTAAASALGYREYPHQEVDTESTDVYSFGVILLEIMTGKPPSEMSTRGSDLQQWMKSFPDGDRKWPLDPELLYDDDDDDKVDDGKVSKAFKLAMKCVDYSRPVRPKSSDLWCQLYDLQ